MTRCLNCLHEVEAGNAICRACGSALADFTAADTTVFPAVDDFPAADDNRRPSAGSDSRPEPLPPWDDAGAGALPARPDGDDAQTPGGLSTRSLVGICFGLVLFIVAGAAYLLIPRSPTHSSGNLAGTAGATTTAGPNSQPATSTSGPSGDERAQAQVVATYLRRSTAARAGITRALIAIGNCADLPTSIGALEAAAETRTQIVASLAPSDVSALPSGADLVSTLEQALTASASADRHYAAWGRAALTSCVGHASSTADYALAKQSDAQSDVAKRKFTQLWNPIAQRLGLPAQEPSTI